MVTEARLNRVCVLMFAKRSFLRLLQLHIILPIVLRCQVLNMHVAEFIKCSLLSGKQALWTSAYRTEHCGRWGHMLKCHKHPAKRYQGN